MSLDGAKLRLHAAMIESNARFGLSHKWKMQRAKLNEIYEHRKRQSSHKHGNQASNQARNFYANSISVHHFFSFSIATSGKLFFPDACAACRMGI